MRSDERPIPPAPGMVPAGRIKMRRVNRPRRSSVRRVRRAVDRPDARAVPRREVGASAARLPRFKAIGLACAIAVLAPGSRAGAGPGGQWKSSPRGRSPRSSSRGTPRSPPDKIKPKLLSRVGQPLDQDRVEADLKTLMGTKWFSDVTVLPRRVASQERQVDLDLRGAGDAPARPRSSSEGGRPFGLKEIEDTTGLKAGNRADPTRTRLAVGQIQRLYQEKGYDLASVTLLEGGNPGDTKIVIEIFEGPKVKVDSISFVGNQFAIGATLRTKIGTRKPILGLFGKYHSDMLDEDRQKLIEYYQAQGFFEVKVTPVTRPGADPGKIDLTFVVSEGTRYKVRNVIIEGNSKIKTEELREGPGAALGQAVHDGGARSRQEPDADQVRRDRLHRRSDRLSSPGSPTSSASSISCTRSRKREPFMLGELEIQGNGRTKDKVIRREAVMAGLLPGEVLDKNRIEIFRRRLMGARLFHERPEAGQADQDRDRESSGPRTSLMAT